MTIQNNDKQTLIELAKYILSEHERDAKDTTAIKKIVSLLVTNGNCQDYFC